MSLWGGWQVLDKGRKGKCFGAIQVEKEGIFVGAFQKKWKVNRPFFSQWGTKAAHDSVHSTDNKKGSWNQRERMGCVLRNQNLLKYCTSNVPRAIGLQGKSLNLSRATNSFSNMFPNFSQLVWSSRIWQDCNYLSLFIFEILKLTIIVYLEEKG